MGRDWRLWGGRLLWALGWAFCVGGFFTGVCRLDIQWSGLVLFKKGRHALPRWTRQSCRAVHFSGFFAGFGLEMF